MFFAGSGTVPGVGVPMVLISGKLAAKRVADYLPGRRGEPRRSRRAEPAGRGLPRECARLTWQHGTTYYWGAALLPRARRKHVHAVYALCRLADDIVDDQAVVDGGGHRPATARALQAFADRLPDRRCAERRAATTR